MSNFCQYLETVSEICSKLLLITTRKLHMHLPLAPRSMTLDDLAILLNFQRISQDFADLGGNNC